ncbi:MAG: DUF2786 domain-containing protein [Acidobacteria bacterium]|nr:DUF2786 domain-containing protein [Acidobacteriota bacterium]
MKVIKKLQKLIAHEQSARAIGNVEEAAAFARRIQSLIDKHNLSMSEVELETAQNSTIDIEPVGDRLGDIETWQISLLQNIARLNGCHSLKHNAGFQVVVGRQIDRQITINLYLYFETLGRELAEKFLQNRNIVFSAVYAGFFVSALNSTAEDRRRSFLLGFVASVCQRLEETAKVNAAAKQSSQALVFIGNKQKENREWMDARLNITQEESDLTRIDSSAFAQGASAGNEIALTDKTLC